MNFIFLAKQGTGKGTYAQAMQEKYGLVQVSTGDLCREEAKKNTETGKKVAEALKAGKYVDDAIVTELLRQRLQEPDCGKGFILEGYPRTLEQTTILDKMLEGMGKKINAVVYFAASEATLLDRLTGRRQCRKCFKVYHVRNIPPKKPGVCDACGGEVYQREDDSEEMIRKRFKEYDSKTKPLIDYYKNKGLLVEVNADEALEKVKEQLSIIVEKG